MVYRFMTQSHYTHNKKAKAIAVLHLKITMSFNKTEFSIYVPGIT